MVALDMLRSFIEYGVAMSRWVWNSIGQITDHRSKVLQKLREYGAPSFDQDFIIWLAQKA
jgi:hypothetical protein